jgi:ubiquinone/menaquinone biosynthesis C-methylase UbiE
MLSTDDRTFAGSIPEIYDLYLVPQILEAYALDLADRVSKVNAVEVLETAAGTGVLTRAMAARLPAHARILATDLNQPMLDRAKARQGHDPRIQSIQADALSLPFPDANFGVVACQFGVMFFPDKIKAYHEARRVLKPGGQFVFNVWDRISENEFADTVTEALAKLFPLDPPRFMARTPHGYHDLERIEAELSEAGFSDVSIDVVDHRSSALSPREAAIAFCQGSPLRNEIEARDQSRLLEATDRAAEALADRFGDHHISGRMRAFVITGRR